MKSSNHLIRIRFGFGWWFEQRFSTSFQPLWWHNCPNGRWRISWKVDKASERREAVEQRWNSWISEILERLRTQKKCRWAENENIFMKGQQLVHHLTKHLAITKTSWNVNAEFMISIPSQRSRKSFVTAFEVSCVGSCTLELSVFSKFLRNETILWVLDFLNVELTQQTYLKFWIDHE